jgi:hypothetical protein
MIWTTSSGAVWPNSIKTLSRYLKTLGVVLFFLAQPLHAATFAAWVSSYGLSGDAAAPTADPDADGYSNVLEYALDGMNPTVGDSNVDAAVKLRFQTRNTAGDYSAVLTTPPTGTTGTHHVVIRYKLRADTEGIRVYARVSSKDLVKWGWGDSAVTVWTDSGYTYARARSDARKWGGRQFMQLRAEQIP